MYTLPSTLLPCLALAGLSLLLLSGCRVEAQLNFDDERDVVLVTCAGNDPVVTGSSPAGFLVTGGSCARAIEDLLEDDDLDLRIEAVTALNNSLVYTLIDQDFP